MNALDRLAAARPFETGALLAIAEQSGLDVVTLIEGLEREELLRSRLTRPEVRRLLRQMAGSLGALDPALRRAMPELDWEGWQTLAPRLARHSGETLDESETADETLWFACASLVPATLLWLRVYRRNQPALFRQAPPL